MPEALAHGYPSESTQQELSNKYQHEEVLKSVFKNHYYILVLWTKVAPALEGSTLLRSMALAPDLKQQTVHIIL